MKAPTQTQITLGMSLAVMGLLYFAFKKSGNVLSGIQAQVMQVYDQTKADIQSAVANNITAPFERGQAYMAGEKPFVSSKAFLYSDANYTGNDPTTGQPFIDGEWYSDPEARRYEAEQRAKGVTPGFTSANGAAFGFYANPRASDATAARLEYQTGQAFAPNFGIINPGAGWDN